MIGTCIQCHEPITELKRVRAADGSFWLSHACGAVYTPAFVEDRFGVTLKEPLKDRVVG